MMIMPSTNKTQNTPAFAARRLTAEGKAANRALARKLALGELAFFNRERSAYCPGGYRPSSGIIEHLRRLDLHEQLATLSNSPEERQKYIEKTKESIGILKCLIDHLVHPEPGLRGPQNIRGDEPELLIVARVLEDPALQKKLGIEIKKNVSIRVIK
jgi:hypothetical protein